MKIDVHMHLAGTGCCSSGCWVSPSFRKRSTFRLLKLMHGITEHAMATTVDADWAARIARLIRESEVDRGVVLGFDGVYDHAKGDFDERQSQLVVPPEWVFSVCEKHPELLPGPSINPHRKDAISRLEYCIERGAVLIKWLPAAQAIDPSAPRLADFYRIAARAKMPLLIHMGGERTFKTVTPEYNDVEHLRAPLEAGVPVICAHTATRVLGTKDPDQIPALKALLREFPHLYVDNSGITNPSRFSHLPGLANDDEITSRTLFGSDWPVPANAFYYFRQLGFRRVRALEKIKNTIDRDLNIKRDFGYPDETLTRAAGILPNLARWGGKNAGR